MIRVNAGCGSVVVDGWVNVDREWSAGSGVFYGDMRSHLPFDDDSVDYIVANHSLSDLTHHELPGALAELRRVLKPGGVLRILVPDLLGAVDAYRRDDYEWFPLGSDLPSMDERLCTFVPWFGTVGSVWTANYANRLCTDAGFVAFEQCAPHESLLAPGSGITDLDDRERQALILEGRK